MDDLLCYSPTLEQHLKDVREVLGILRQEKLYVKATKCAFARSELGFLGHRVSAAGVAVDPQKVAAVRDWPTPTTSVDLRRFVGLCNHYRCFIEGYAVSRHPSCDYVAHTLPGPGRPRHKTASTVSSSA